MGKQIVLQAIALILFIFGVLMSYIHMTSENNPSFKLTLVAPFMVAIALMIVSRSKEFNK